MSMLDHKPTERAQALRLLESLKAEAAKRGRSEEEVEGERRAQLDRCMGAGEIAACEFAEMHLFDDMDADSEEVAGAAFAGTPSDVTLAMAERDGYCLRCVRLWFSHFAAAFRSLARTT